MNSLSVQHGLTGLALAWLFALGVAQCCGNTALQAYTFLSSFFPLHHYVMAGSAVLSMPKHPLRFDMTLKSLKSLKSLPAASLCDGGIYAALRHNSH